MAHHGYPTLNHSLNHIFMPVYALKFDGVCAGCHQDGCRVQRRGQSFPEREKRHVRDDEFSVRAARNRRRMKTHQIDAGGKCRRMAMHHHSGAVADKNSVDRRFSRAAGQTCSRNT